MKRHNQRRLPREPKQPVERLDLDGDSVDSFQKQGWSFRHLRLDGSVSNRSRNSASHPNGGQYEQERGYSHDVYNEERLEPIIVEDYDRIGANVGDRNNSGFARGNNVRDMARHYQNLSNQYEQRDSLSPTVTRNLPPISARRLMPTGRRTPIEEHGRWSEGVPAQSLDRSGAVPNNQHRDLYSDLERGNHPVDNRSTMLKVRPSDGRSESSSITRSRLQRNRPGSRPLSTKYAPLTPSGRYEPYDPEWDDIKKKFLRPDSWSYASTASSYRGSSTSGSSCRYISHEEEQETQSLPRGFFRRKDGVIMSVASSISSARDVERYNDDYTSTLLPETTEEIEIRQMDEIEEQQQRQMLSMNPRQQNESCEPQSANESPIETKDSRSSHDKNLIEHSTLESTLHENTTPGSAHGSLTKTTTTTKRNDGNMSLSATVAWLFQEPIDDKRSGLDLNSPPSIATASSESRARVRQGMIPANKFATSHSIRRAKVKSDGSSSKSSARKSAPNEPSGTTIQEQERASTPILGSTKDGDARRLGSVEDDVSNSRTHDNSTITTKASYAQTLNAVVATSPLQRCDTENIQSVLVIDRSGSPSGAAGPPFQQQPQATMMGEDLKNPHIDDKSLLSTGKEQEEMYNHLLPFNPKQGFSGIFPDRTRQGDRVPELIFHQPAGCSVISDLSSAIHRSKMSSQSPEHFRRGGEERDSTITYTNTLGGFFDKLALACRLAVFQPNGCE